MDHDLEPHTTSFRGSRRATDALEMAAGFVYSLLTEPPR